MALIKALKIDVIKKQVDEIMIENSLQGMYKAAECDIVEFIHFANVPFGNRGETNEMLVDEEGRIKPNVQGQFIWKGKFLFHGHGIIIGYDHRSDEMASHTCNIEEIRQLVKFAE